MASANTLIRFAFSAAGAGGVVCSGLPQHNGTGAGWLYTAGIIGATKGDAVLVAVLKGLTWMLHVA